MYALPSAPVLARVRTRMNNIEYFSPKLRGGSFSAVSTPIFASKYALESSLSARLSGRHRKTSHCEPAGGRGADHRVGCLGAQRVAHAGAQRGVQCAIGNCRPAAAPFRCSLFSFATADRRLRLRALKARRARARIFSKGVPIPFSSFFTIFQILILF